MKKLILLALISIVFYSCNQASKTPDMKAEASSKDTIAKSESPGIDIVQSSPGQAKVLLENENVRVVEYSVKPGEKDEWHTHPPRSSYVVSGGKLQVFTETDEPKTVEVISGTASWAGRGAKHYVKNVGDTQVTIILTEIKALN